MARAEVPRGAVQPAGRRSMSASAGGWHRGGRRRLWRWRLDDHFYLTALAARCLYSLLGNVIADNVSRHYVLAARQSGVAVQRQRLRCRIIDQGICTCADGGIFWTGAGMIQIRWMPCQIGNELPPLFLPPLHSAAIHFHGVRTYPDVADVDRFIATDQFGVVRGYGDRTRGS